MLNCKQASELMSQGMDAQLPLAKRMSLRIHLMMCHGCNNFLAQMRFLRMAAKRYGDEGMPRLSAQARKRIAKELREFQTKEQPANKNGEQ